MKLYMFLALCISGILFIIYDGESIVNVPATPGANTTVVNDELNSSLVSRPENKKPSSIKIVVAEEQHCDAKTKSDSQQRISSLLVEREGVRSDLFHGLRTIDDIEVERTLSTWGVPVHKYREYKTNYPKDFFRLSPVDGRIHIPEGDDIVTIHSAISNKDYKPLQLLFEDNSLNKLSNFSGYSVLSAIMLTNPTINYETIRDLIKSGMNVNFADLVYATYANVSLDVLELLSLNYPGDINKVWVNGVRKDNLLITAATKANLSAFYHWLNLGVSPKISDVEFNALDLLPYPNSQKEKHVNDKIFERLALEYIYPYTKKNYENLKDKLSPNTIEENRAYFSSGNFHYGIEEFSAVDFDHKEYEKINAEISSIYEYLTWCGLELNPEIMGEITSQSTVNNNNIGERVEFVKSMYADFAKTENEIDGLINDLNKLLYTKKWDEYIDTFFQSSTPLTSSELSSIPTMQLIRFGAPVEKISKAINMGATFDSLSIFTIIHYDRVDLIDKLIPLGLDINETDLQGKTALDYAREKNDKMVEKLERYF